MRTRRARRDPLLLGVELQHGRPLHVGLDLVVDEDVMHDLAVPRPDLDGLHPLRLGEVRRDVEVLVRRSCRRPGSCSPPASPGRRPACRSTSLAGTGAPAAGPSDRPSARRWRPTAGCVLFSSAVRPALVEERSGRHVGVPRRHGPFRDLVPDVPGVRPDVVVRQQRHRRDFAGPVARRAVLVKDGRDILCVGRARWRPQAARPEGRPPGRRDRPTRPQQDTAGSA